MKAFASPSAFSLLQRGHEADRHDHRRQTPRPHPRKTAASTKTPSASTPSSSPRRSRSQPLQARRHHDQHLHARERLPSSCNSCNRSPRCAAGRPTSLPRRTLGNYLLMDFMSRRSKHINCEGFAAHYENRHQQITRGATIVWANQTEVNACSNSCSRAHSRSRSYQHPRNSSNIPSATPPSPQKNASTICFADDAPTRRSTALAPTAVPRWAFRTSASSEGIHGVVQRERAGTRAHHHHAVSATARHGRVLGPGLSARPAALKATKRASSRRPRNTTARS